MTTKRSLMTSLLLAATLAGGCAGTIGNNGTIKLSGPGPTMAAGAGLVVLGGALTYKVRTDGENQYNTDPLFTGVGVGMMAVGAGAILYGAYQLSTQSDQPAAPMPAPRTLSVR